MSLLCSCLSKNPDKAIPEGITWGLVAEPKLPIFKLFLEHPYPVYNLLYQYQNFTWKWLLNKVETSRETFAKLKNAENEPSLKKRKKWKQLKETNKSWQTGTVKHSKSSKLAKATGNFSIRAEQTESHQIFVNYQKKLKRFSQNDRLRPPN